MILVLLLVQQKKKKKLIRICTRAQLSRNRVTKIDEREAPVFILKNKRPEARGMHVFACQKTKRARKDKKFCYLSATIIITLNLPRPQGGGTNTSRFLCAIFFYFFLRPYILLYL
jgi:hypothetical protein